jgi:hypothetical protein
MNLSFPFCALNWFSASICVHSTSKRPDSNASMLTDMKETGISSNGRTVSGFLDMDTRIEQPSVKSKSLEESIREKKRKMQKVTSGSQTLLGV